MLDTSRLKPTQDHKIVVTMARMHRAAVSTQAMPARRLEMETRFESFSPKIGSLRSPNMAGVT